MGSAGTGRGDPRMARQVNDRRALDLFAAHGPMTRTQLRERTGLAQPTIIDLVKRLEQAGLIEATGASSATRSGPRPVVYGLTPGQVWVVTAHVLDRRVAVSVGDLAGDDSGGRTWLEPLQHDRLPDQIGDLVDRAAAAAGLASVPDRTRPTQVVVSVPGTVDRRSGDLAFSWDLRRWQGGLLDPLTHRLGAPVELVNHVHLVALAEGADRGGAGEDHALVWIGTGLGLSLVTDGRPWFGAGGAAGQIGFMPVPGAPVAPIDPSRESFEADLQGLLGAAAVQDLARGFGVARADVGATVRAAVSDEDDPRAAHFVAELGRRIALALAVITTVADPGRFVLHGETGIAGGDRLAAVVADRLTSMSAGPVEVTVGSWADGDAAALRGARLVAERHARRARWGGLDASVAVH